MIRAYYASVSFMDAQVGRVIDELDRLKLREKTIIVFFATVSYHLGEKGKWSKAYSLFDIAIRVPLIIAMPNGKPGASPRTVGLLDLCPTLVEFCGLPQPYKAPSKLEGNSLIPLLAIQMLSGTIQRSVWSSTRARLVSRCEPNAGTMSSGNTVLSEKCRSTVSTIHLN